MQKRMLAIYMMLCMVFGTIGQNPFASAGGSATARAVSVSESTGEEGQVTKEPSEDERKSDEKALETTITTSDGATYEIQVTYTDDCGIPANGTELLVSEIKPEEAGYDAYVDASMEQLGAEDDAILFARVFDISIADAKDHSLIYEPEGAVRVSIRLTGRNLDACKKVDVLHIAEQKRRSVKSIKAAPLGASFNVDRMNPSVKGESVTFTTDGFSIYVIVGHEGQEVVETPRVTVHFLSPITEDSQESFVNGEYRYTTAPYSFMNIAGNAQTSQIVQNGETLELISNPPNRMDKFFYGWYVVDYVSGDDDAVTFRWNDSPKRLAFETPVGVTDNGNGTFTMTWTSDGTACSATAEMDSEDYSAHIYVMPLYENYCFVNFHELAYAVSSTGSLLTRKLVILGSDGTESVLVSDVMAPTTDTIRRIFRGWQYRTNDTWISAQTVDNHSNFITKRIDVTETVDLYPYFQEGRWLYFNVGESGNGAKYVPARFELAEFNEENGSASVGGTLTSLPTTERVGYDFGGWRVITGYEDDDPKKPIYQLVTDSDGNFLSSVTLEIEEEYKDYDNHTRVGVAYTIENGELTLKYPLSELTFYAQWNEKQNSKYTVVIWKQKNTDAYGTTKKTYDYYVLNTDVLPAEINSASGRTLEQLGSELSAYRNLTTNNDLKADFVGFRYDRSEMSDATVRGDGSTVVHIYYDRMAYELKFFFARRSVDANGTESGNFDVPVLSGRFNPPSSVTWLDYCTGGSGRNWDSAGTNRISDVFKGDLQDVHFAMGNTNAGRFNYYYYVIRANYGTNIADLWPKYDDFPTVGNRTLASWWMMATAGNYGSAGQNDTVKGVISILDEKILGNVNSADGNFLLASYRTNAPNEWRYNVYMETLDGVDYSGKTLETHGGVVYYLDSSFVARSSSAQFNQQIDPPYEGFSCNENYSYSPSSLVANYFYDRHTHTFAFDYNYPIRTGMAEKEVKIDGVPYGTSFDRFNHQTHEDAEWPSDADIPDHFEFRGWFADESGSIPFDFTSTMPDADMIAYGKWEPVYYTIGIDPAGGTINHINYDEAESDGYPTFSLAGLAQATLGVDEKWDAALNAVGGDKSWIATLMATGEGHNTSQATYFSAVYGGTIGEYELERLYTECDETAEGTKYYYVNMQFDKTGSVWGLHGDLRNAVYLTEEQLEAYYMYCKAAAAWHDAARPGNYDATIPATFEAFKELYVTKNDIGEYVTYKKVEAGSYEFVGWYIKNPDGSLSDNPYIFANVIENPFTIRGVWRRVGNFYIAYDTVFKLDDSSIVSGSIPNWTDPADNTSAKYIDGAPTTTMQQPTDITLNGQPAGDAVIFRGWQIVRVTGYENGVAQYTPLSSVYYDAAVPFVINAAYADDRNCIHMQAIYQSVNESDRRPKVANLILDANDGYLVRADGTRIQTTDDNVPIASITGWKHGKIVEDAAAQEIVFGDMQSNAAVHFYKYGVTAGMLEAYPNSTNFFKHPDGYLLIGFDEGSDYSLERTAVTTDDLKTGDAFIPTYFADSAVSLQRTDSARLYTVWEPMVYVTFENRTTQPVTFTISSDAGTLSVVNEVTGVFSREKYTETTVTLTAGEKISFVMPRGANKPFTINGTNESTSQLLTVSSWFQGVKTGQTVAGPYRSSGAEFDMTDTLRTDPNGVMVYFDGTDTVFYDLNDSAEAPATWTDNARTGSDFDTVTNSSSLVFVDDGSLGMIYAPITLPTVAPEPSAPTRGNQTFIGWVADEAAAHCDLLGYTLPGTDESNHINNLAVIRSNYLWDFSTEITEGMTLYAVWGETVTVKFHLYNNNQVWNNGNDNTYFVPGANRTYTVTMIKGDIVNMPLAPTRTGNTFYRWVKTTSYQTGTTPIANILTADIFNFGEPVQSDLDLYTSWTNAQSINVTVSKNVVNGLGDDNQKDFIFKARITTTTYTATATRTSSGRYTYTWTLTQPTSSSVYEDVTFTLKHGESRDIPLYYYETDRRTINNNGTTTFTVFFQSIEVIETEDPGFTTTVADSSWVSTLVSGPSLSPTNNESTASRQITLSGTPNTANATIVFTNTRTKTDVTVRKTVQPDDYLSGDEEFAFTAVYKDSQGNTVYPAAADGYTVSGDEATFTLKDGESVLLHGVPIGGSVTVVESAAGFTAESTDGTNTAAEEFTLTNVSADGTDVITFTNSRDTYDVTVSNEVLREVYGDTESAFVYTATLWNGDTQAVFPSTLTASDMMSLGNGRKEMQIFLKSGEAYAIEGLPGGYKLVVTQTAAENYITESRLAPDDFAETLTVTIDALDDDAQIDFRNTLKTGSYKVTKNVHLEEGQVLPPNTEFTFTAKLLRTISDTTPVEITADLAAVLTAAGATVSENVISFSLPSGGEIVLTGLPVGYYLQVQESASGYAAYVNNIRTSSVTVQIAEGTNSDINFTNRKTHIILQIQKVDGDTLTAIQGAQFIVYRMVNEEQRTLYTLSSNEEGWLTATESGTVVLRLDLENGVYYLRETATVSGYTILEDTVIITVDSSQADPESIVRLSGSDQVSIAVPTEEGEPYTVTVKNQKNIPAPTGYPESRLPFLIILLAGVILLGGFVICRKRRIEDEG